VKRVLVFIAHIALLSTISSTAFAVTPVKMTTLKPTAQIQLSGDPSDQISSLQVSPTSIIVTGTSAGAGYMKALDRTGQTQLWDLHLVSENSTDSMANAVYREPSGTLWVAGASAIVPAQSTPTPIPSTVLNPSGVMPETTTAIASLTELDIWKVSSRGLLLGSFKLSMGNVVFPDSISVIGGKVTVGGEIAARIQTRFSISMDVSGLFSAPKFSSIKNSALNSTKEVKTTLSTWKSFITSTPIKGLPSWKPKANSQVLVRYDGKTKAVKAAYLTSEEILDLAWEKSLGIVLLLSSTSGYAISIVK